MINNFIITTISFINLIFVNDLLNLTLVVINYLITINERMIMYYNK